MQYLTLSVLKFPLLFKISRVIICHLFKGRIPYVADIGMNHPDLSARKKPQPSVWSVVDGSLQLEFPKCPPWPLH